jgi:hypothetical protein
MGVKLSPTAQELQHKLGKADVQQIQLMLRVSPEKRLETMLNMQNIVLTTWRNRLRAANPSLTDLELSKLVFKRLRQNGGT